MFVINFSEPSDNQNSDPGKGSKGFSKEDSYIGYNIPIQNLMEGTGMVTACAVNSAVNSTRR